MTPIPEPSPLTVRIGRAWMGLGVTEAEFTATPKPKRWAEHRRLVAYQFRLSPPKYRDRVVALVQMATDAGAEVVLLPSCALAHAGRRLKLEDYDLSSVPVVVAGALDVGGEAGAFAIAARSGAIVERFDDQQIRWFDGGRYSVMAVISSAIKRLADEEPTRSTTAPPSEGPVLVLNVGQHPHSDTYRRNTLGAAAEAAQRRAGHPAAVVLASWQYAGVRPKPSWCMPEERASYRRIWEGQDLLDIVDVSLD